MLGTITAEPLYEKVKKQLLTYIDKEKPRILPREKDLISLLGVSRNTIRHAVQDLSNAGVLKPIQGRGTVVLKYAKDRACDIGVICTDRLDVSDPWIASIFSSLREAAHTEGYHLNLFFCHDYSINPSNNSAYSYLINSGKLTGLILLSPLKYEDILHIKNIGLPFVTVDFKYCDLEYSYVLSDYLDKVSNVIDKYVVADFKRFAITARTGEIIMGTKCKGLNELIIENWEAMLHTKKLPIVPHDFSLNLADQIRAMHALSPELRPELIFTPFIAHSQEIKAVLSEFLDWNPVHITSKMKGCETDATSIITDPSTSARKAFSLLHRIIAEHQSIESVNC
jgi:Bacterial regulatory proteins, gntR family